jgi:hypothetical protein
MAALLAWILLHDERLGGGLMDDIDDDQEAKTNLRGFLTQEERDALRAQDEIARAQIEADLAKLEDPKLQLLWGGGQPVVRPGIPPDIAKHLGES